MISLLEQETPISSSVPGRVPLSSTGKTALDVAKLACRQAGEVLVAHLGAVEHVKHKGVRDIQTDVDLMSEKLIKNMLNTEFPLDAVVTEESAAQPGTSGYKWIIDPIDGTNNYFFGLPYFAINIALARDGDRGAQTPSFPRLRESRGGGEGVAADNRHYPESTVLGVVPDPERVGLRDEPDYGGSFIVRGEPRFMTDSRVRGNPGGAGRASANEEILLGVTYAPMLNELFWAEKGKGAFLNGRPIRVSAVEKLKDCLVSFDMGYNQDQGAKMIELAKTIWPRAHTLRLLGSGALGLAYVACGRLGVYFHRSLYPWDVAPGILLIQEAGGVVEAWGRQPITLSSGNIVASSPVLMEEFHSVIAGSPFVA